MPPFQYTLAHSGAKLTDAQRQILIKGFAAGAQASQAASGESNGSTQTPSANASGSAAAVAAIQQDCGSCHSADQALAFRASSSQEAQALIQQMVQRGASVPDQDAQLMIQYWTR